MTAAMARQLAPLKSQTVRCDAWQMKSQRLVVRIRYQLVVDASIVLCPSVTARMCTSRRWEKKSGSENTPLNWKAAE